MNSAQPENYPLLLSELENYLVPRIGSLGTLLAKKVMADCKGLLDRGAIAYFDNDLWVCQDFLRHLSKKTEGLVLSTKPEKERIKRAYSPRRRGSSEAKVSDALAREIGGEREVRCKFGYIDVLSATEIIEVKSFKDWKNAVGQILIYGSQFPSHRKRVHLYGEGSLDLLEIQEVCGTLGVTVTLDNSQS